MNNQYESYRDRREKQVTRVSVFILIGLIIAIMAVVFGAVCSQAQIVKIDKIYDASSFSTISTVYVGAILGDIGNCDSLLVVSENYDSLTAKIQLVYYSPNLIAIDTVTAIDTYTTATVTNVRTSTAVIPEVRNYYVKTLVTARSTNGQTTNATQLRIYIYRKGWTINPP